MPQRKPSLRAANLFLVHHHRSGNRALDRAARYRWVERKLRLFGFPHSRVVPRSNSPPLVENAPYSVALSSSGEWVACLLVHRRTRLSVDLERSRFHESLEDIRNIARLSFTPGERNELCRATDPAALFFRVWTEKEAVAKLATADILAQARHIDTLSARIDSSGYGVPIGPKPRLRAHPAPHRSPSRFSKLRGRRAGLHPAVLTDGAYGSRRVRFRRRAVIHTFDDRGSIRAYTASVRLPGKLVLSIATTVPGAVRSIRIYGRTNALW